MPEAVFDLFSNLSIEFDARYKSDPNFIERLQTWTSLIDKYLRPGDTVYDLGCGPGVFSFYAASKGGHVTGIDGSEGMIGLCRQKMANLKAPLPLQFVQDTLPLESTSDLPKASLILCSSMFEYIPDKAKMAECFGSLLRENGILLVSVPNRKSIYRTLEMAMYTIFRRPSYLAHVHHQFTAAGFESFMSGFGFRAVEKKYYADRYFLSGLLRLLPEQTRCNLLLMAYRLEKKT